MTVTIERVTGAADAARALRRVAGEAREDGRLAAILERDDVLLTFPSP